jgi:CRISPR-associated protein Csx14
MDPKTTLIATLGGQPQKVTFLLDLLLARGEEIDQVAVVYISSYKRTQNAIKLLEVEFLAGKYSDRPCQLKRIPLKSGHSDLFDIRTPEDVEAARQNIHQLLSELKKENQRIHIGLSGGRRLMSMIALAAAMQYLTPVDHLWHINASADVLEKSRDGKIMHLPPESEVYLLPVPFVPWVSYFPGLADLLNRSPQEIGETTRGWLDVKERDNCMRVWKELTHRQQEVLQAFASGLSRQEVAQKLGIAVTTVDSHRDSILSRCELMWETQSGGDFDTQFLQRYFGPFLAGILE